MSTPLPAVCNTIWQTHRKARTIRASRMKTTVWHNCKVCYFSGMQACPRSKIAPCLCPFCSLSSNFLLSVKTPIPSPYTHKSPVSPIWSFRYSAGHAGTTVAPAPTDLHRINRITPESLCRTFGGYFYFVSTFMVTLIISTSSPSSYLPE